MGMYTKSLEKKNGKKMMFVDGKVMYRKESSQVQVNVCIWYIFNLKS